MLWPHIRCRTKNPKGKAARDLVGASHPSAAAIEPPDLSQRLSDENWDAHRSLQFGSSSHSSDDGFGDRKTAQTVHSGCP